MNFNSLFSSRSKEERIRLGLTQAQIASICGVSREMWGKYERGIALAGSEVLFSLTSVGVDVGYLFSGQRSTVLNAEEAALLDDYRESNEQGKEAIERTAKVAAENEALKVRALAA